MLRGSMSSVMGTVGLNLPLRAVERLTSAVERAAAMLERFDDAGGTTRALDLLKRGDETLDVLAKMHQDTRAMRKRLDSLEAEVRGLKAVLTDRRSGRA